MFGVKRLENLHHLVLMVELALEVKMELFLLLLAMAMYNL